MNRMNPNSAPMSTPSPWRRIVCSLFFIGAAIAAVGAVASSRSIGNASSADQSPVAQKIAPWVIEHTANGQQAEVFVVLVDQANLSQAAALHTKSEKGRYVHNTLFNKSQTTQRPILQWLRERGIEHHSFYVVNAILVNGTRAVADALAVRPDVARIEGNPRIHNNLPQPRPTVEAPPYLQRPATIEPGIVYTHAPDVWALGFTGQNIVVASADSGVRWTHNALKPHYRGWDGQNVDHNYNWHDSIRDSVGNPCGNDSPFPCDDNTHGSHTAGTAIGDDGMGNQIGMAWTRATAHRPDTSSSWNFSLRLMQ
jgi:serine protease AprX